MTKERKTWYDDVKTISALNPALLKASLMKMTVPIVPRKFKKDLKKTKQWICQLNWTQGLKQQQTTETLNSIKSDTKKDR